MEISIINENPFNPVEISMKYQFKFQRKTNENLVVISIKHQWKSIGNPIEISMKICKISMK